VDGLEVDFVVDASREMAWNGPKRVSAIRAKGGPRQIDGSRRHPEGHGLVDQIRRKASLAMTRHRHARLCLTLIDDAHGEIRFQSVHRA
jgi:hypothetical protein